MNAVSKKKCGNGSSAGRGRLIETCRYVISYPTEIMAVTAITLGLIAN